MNEIDWFKWPLDYVISYKIWAPAAARCWSCRENLCRCANKQNSLQKCDEAPSRKTSKWSAASRQWAMMSGMADSERRQLTTQGDFSSTVIASLFLAQATPHVRTPPTPPKRRCLVIFVLFKLWGKWSTGVRISGCCGGNSYNMNSGTIKALKQRSKILKNLFLN